MFNESGFVNTPRANLSEPIARYKLVVFLVAILLVGKGVERLEGGFLVDR